MDYTTILDAPGWHAVGLSALQSTVLYFLVLICLKLAGRRMFAEMGAQDLVVLLLVADAANLGLTHEGAGFWASFFSVLTVIGLGSVIEDVPVLRHLVEGHAIVLYDKGRLNRKKMRRHRVETSDLNETARLYGLEDYRKFKRVVLESDGEITGVLPGRLHTHN